MHDYVKAAKIRPRILIRCVLKSISWRAVRAASKWLTEHDLEWYVCCVFNMQTASRSHRAQAKSSKLLCFNFAICLIAWDVAIHRLQMKSKSSTPVCHGPEQNHYAIAAWHQGNGEIFIIQYWIKRFEYRGERRTVSRIEYVSEEYFTGIDAGVWWCCIVAIVDCIMYSLPSMFVNSFPNCQTDVIADGDTHYR